MTVLEAAAFATPSLLDGGGGVGALSRLRPGDHGEALTANFGTGPIEDTAAAIVALLERVGSSGHVSARKLQQH